MKNSKIDGTAWQVPVLVIDTHHEMIESVPCYRNQWQEVKPAKTMKEYNSQHIYNTEKENGHTIVAVAIATET